MNLNAEKPSSSKKISAIILKQSVHIYLPFLINYIIQSFVANKFPDELKESEVIPLYKKLDPLQKENYRPVSLLPIQNFHPCLLPLIFSTRLNTTYLRMPTPLSQFPKP